MDRVSSVFILTSVGLALHGWLFKDTHFKSETNDSPKLPIVEAPTNPKINK